MKIINKFSLQVSFFQENIEILHANKTKKVVEYHQLSAFTYYLPYDTKTSPCNYLIINKKKIKIDPITKDDKNFIDFCRWIKSKNKAIKIKIDPSDNYLNHLYQEEFGFNYR